MSTGRPRVLVVEDDEEISDMVTLVLEDRGWEVAVAQHGQAALDRLHAGLQPDVILLDMRMPVMDGRTFVARYRAEPLPRVPIIVVSAARDAREVAASVCADDWLAKPFDVSALVDVVRRHSPGEPARAASAAKPRSDTAT